MLQDSLVRQLSKSLKEIFDVFILHFYIITEMHRSGITNAPIICQLGRALTQFVFRLLQHRQIFRRKCCDLHSLVALVM